ncbi:MAG: FkbM family methyltransferase [Hyphomicrobiales bacterium]
MKNFQNFLKTRTRKLFKPKSIVVDGARVTTDLRYVSKGIRNGLYKEIYEREERLLIQNAVSKNDRILEAGAGIGIVSLLCAKICGPSNILSYEPNVTVEEIVTKNFKLNGMQPKIEFKALAQKKGRVDLFLAENIFSSSVFDRSIGVKTSVEADAILDVQKTFAPNVIIMDVEGAETNLLPACDLSDIDKIVVELHPHIVGENENNKLLQHLIENNFQKKIELGDCVYLEK